MKIKPLIVLLLVFLQIGCNHDSASITTFELPFEHSSKPSLDNKEFLISVSKNSAYINTIIKYDMNRKKIDTIFTSTLPNPAINDLAENSNWIIWVESDETGAKSKIIARNKNNHQEKIIYKSRDDFSSLVAPHLYNEYVSWIDFDGEYKVFLYNLLTDEREIISTIQTPSFYNNFVHIDNYKLLWTDHVDHEGFYYIYDIIDRKLTSYKAPFKYPGYAKLSSHLIFSINFNDFRIWSSQEFGYYDLHTKKYTKLKDVPIQRFELKDDKLAIINSDQKLELYKLKLDNQKTIVKEIGIEKSIFPVDSIDFSYDGKLIITKDEQKKIWVQIIDF